MKPEKNDIIARKNRMKRVRVVVQLIILVLCLMAVAVIMFGLKEYQPYQQRPDISLGTNEDGFVALSYFGVSRKGDATLISRSRLQEHLQALQKRGYVTITQQDILDYYQEGKALPRKALFLLFEDGRSDTAIFASDQLESMNMKATCLTYSEKFARENTKFLQPDQLKELTRTSYWELGTNGYRLSYINVFDRYNNYLGELTPLQYAMIAPYLGREYNHYLMDYIRDAEGLPQESFQRMKARISYDYEQMADAYSKQIGYLPALYVLMHSNTGEFGNNDRVSAVNEYWIRKNFSMNFNREGDCYNRRNSSVYDLTRMQPQAYWPVNHLLMKIQDDTQQAMLFETGKPDFAGAWELSGGAAEFKDETIFLTSEPKAEARMRLKTAENIRDIKISTIMRGNKLGIQRIYLRSDAMLQRGLVMGIENNILVVNERTGLGEEKNIFWLNLDELDGVKNFSVDEDRKAAETRELETFVRYASSPKEAQEYLGRLQEKERETVRGLEDGAEQYQKPISTNAPGNRQFEAEIRGERITIHMDGKPVVKDLVTQINDAGTVWLAAGWSGYGWNQRNLVDDVYDGVFEKLTLQECSEGKADRMLFDGQLHGWEGMLFLAKESWEAVILWFITHL